MTKQFKQRLIISSLGVLALIACIYASYIPLFQPIFILLNIGVICLALLEYYQLAKKKGFQPLTLAGIGSTIAYMIALPFGFYQISLVGLPFLILLISFLIFSLMHFHQYFSSLGNLAVTVFGIVYLTIPLSCGICINYFFPAHGLQDGRLWLAYVLITTKMTDVGAYFCGKSFGKRKLAPKISPKKTIEGALGGLGAALITSFLFSNQGLAILDLPFLQSLWLGLLVGVLAQLGDLTESLLKRDAGVSDSGHLPGLGGILDVVDSLVFTLPLMYIFLQMHWIG